jgi:predicted nucleotide-binding protein (sugar kinase/HSP70/actin superfamily)
MKVGIPKGLLYCRYYPFLHSFFKGLGTDIITSSDTNKEILDLGVKYCVDEACVPIKIFHGHIASIKDKCDVIVIPRIMQLYKREYICPKFCGLPEMVVNNVPNMPKAITSPIYVYSTAMLKAWALEAGRLTGKRDYLIKKALNNAITSQKKFKTGIRDENYKLNIGLVGHPYNIYDKYINMNLIKKLNLLGAGVMTEETISEYISIEETKKLYKRPFWTFTRKNYGFASYASRNKVLDGIIYLSSFACGIDSITTELIKDEIGETPFMILKLDEHTGEAGFDTRIEAFVDMLERRNLIENNLSTFR